VSRRRRPRRRKPRPLRVSLVDRVGPVELASRRPAPVRPSLLPSLFRSARDVLGVLMAATGLSLAARPDSQISLLPGSPTTVVLSAAGEPSAAFVLPIAESEARRLFGQPAPEPRDRLLERLFEEERQAELMMPDEQVDQSRAYAWGLESS